MIERPPRICPYCHAVIEGDPEYCPECGRASSGAPAPRVRADSTVKIVDVDIPFGSLFVLIVKCSVAAIPALILLSIVVGALSMFFTALVSLR